ncbi:hypothetical protein STSO111631_06765 [Stackebrandtia soli]
MRVGDPAFGVEIWPLWNCVVSEERGSEGVRWALDDARFTGTCEVWLKRLSDDSCLARAFVRVDPRRPWPDLAVKWHRRRARARAQAALWSLKDQLECADSVDAG